MLTQVTNSIKSASIRVRGARFGFYGNDKIEIKYDNTRKRSEKVA